MNHPQLASETRAAINRANSQHSTGPRTAEGKLQSSRNSFKHGLYSHQLVLPGESTEELDELRGSLRADHQPANTTEEILVNEIAEQFWRLRRMRKLEADCMQPENIDSALSRLALIQRLMASAERGLHKSLATLRRLQLDRGFVPQIPRQADDEPADRSPAVGFGPQNRTLVSTLPFENGFLPSIAAGTLAVDEVDGRAAI